MISAESQLYIEVKKLLTLEQMINQDEKSVSLNFQRF